MWATGAGLDADRLRAVVRPVCAEPEVRALSHPGYWGGPITDERYVLVASPSR